MTDYIARPNGCGDGKHFEAGLQMMPEPSQTLGHPSRARDLWQRRATVGTTPEGLDQVPDPLDCVACGDGPFGGLAQLPGQPVPHGAAAMTPYLNAGRRVIIGAKVIWPMLY
jgi:hypothetical protein